MAKLKLDKESVQGFFFNHTEKIVLGVMILLLGLFIWTGSSREGIGAQNPAELARKVEDAAKKIEVSTWDQVKVNYVPVLDHVGRKQVGDAVTSESYYRLDTPLIGSPPNSATPRQDPVIFAVTDLEATLVTASIAYKARPELTDPFAELANLEQKKIEAPKKKSTKKPKKGAGGPAGGGYAEEMAMQMEEMAMGSAGAEGMGAGGYGPGAYGPGAYGSDAMGMGTAAGPAVRADANKFHGFRPTATTSATGSSVIGYSTHLVAVKGLVPYQQQWDEFERVFADAAGYMPSRDIPRFLSFRAQRAEVPSDPNEPLKWDYISWTERVLDSLPKMGWAGFPGELADSKYVLSGVLTMPVPPVMMRDLRPLALHTKVPLQQEEKAKTVERTTPELINVDEVGGVADIGELPAVPGARRPGAGGAGMYGAGMQGMYGSGSEGMAGGGYGAGMAGGGYGAGMGGEGYGMGMMGGAGTQLVRGPQAEFLMVRFFDQIKPGKKYIYRIQVVLEDPNHPQIPQQQPQDRILADTVRTRLATVTADEVKQTAAKKTPIRLFSLTSEWSEPTAPVYVKQQSDTYAGGVTLPPMRDILRTAEPNPPQKTGYALPADGEPTAQVMNLSWNSKYATDVPGILNASRGSFFNQPIQADVIDPVTLVYKIVPDYRLASNELVIDLRGGETLQAAVGTAKALLTPGEVAVLDARGNFVVRNELDDWQLFDKYAPPPPIVVEAAPTPADGYGSETMDYGSSYEGGAVGP